MKVIRCIGLAAFIAVLAHSETSVAQQPNENSGTQVLGIPQNRSTLNASVAITTSGTFQQLLPAQNSTTQRQSLLINNNNISGNCWLFFGPVASAVLSNSILLTAGTSYRDDWPYVSSDAIAGTCQINGGSLYVHSR